MHIDGDSCPHCTAKKIVESTSPSSLDAIISFFANVLSFLVVYKLEKFSQEDQAKSIGSLYADLAKITIKNSVIHRDIQETNVPANENIH